MLEVTLTIIWLTAATNSYRFVKAHMKGGVQYPTMLFVLCLFWPITAAVDICRFRSLRPLKILIQGENYGNQNSRKQ